MGTPPRLFTGKREESEEWLDKLRHYYRANAGVPGFESPIHKVALALTFMDGPDVDEWTRSVGAFIDTLNPQTQDYPAVWTTFCDQFLMQFADSQHQQKARNELEELKMKYLGIDDYISKFESLARLAGYALGNQEMVNMFIKGLSLGVAEDVLKMHTRLGNYNEIKQWAIDSTKARQLIDVIRSSKGPKATSRVFNNNFIPRQNPRPFPSRQGNPQPPRPQYNSSNAPNWMRNQPVPMDTSARFRTPNNRFGRGQFRANTAQEQTSQKPKGPCFNCGKMGHFAHECRSRPQMQANVMDWENDEIDNNLPEPMQPEVNLANLKAQLDSLNSTKREELINMHSIQDFPNA